MYFNLLKTGKHEFLKVWIDSCLLHSTKLPSISKILNIVEALTASNSGQRKNRYFLTGVNEHTVSEPNLNMETQLSIHLQSNCLSLVELSSSQLVTIATLSPSTSSNKLGLVSCIFAISSTRPHRIVVK